MDKKIIYGSLATLLLALAAPLSVEAANVAQPQAAYVHHTTPLMVIRFNQRIVHFQNQLYNTLSQATRVKPGITFEVVSHIPVTGYSNRDQNNEKRAKRNMSKVINTMVEIGIPRNRIRVLTKKDPRIAKDEVQVFVR
jgi:hypothetical protein